MSFKISRHLAGIVQPLCEATEQLLREQEGLSESDVIRVGLEEDVLEQVDGQAYLVSSKRFVCRFKSRDTTKHASYKMRENWWQRIPGAQMMGDGYGFFAPPSDITCLIIFAAVGRAHIEFEDEMSELEFMVNIMRFAKQSKATRGPAGFKKYRTVPNRVPKGHPDFEPMPAQKVAAWAASRNEAYNLWMEQSTGKTYSAIMTMEDSLKKGECQLAIIVCPKNVRSQWANELTRFCRSRVRVIKLMGGSIDRLTLLFEARQAVKSGDYDLVVVICSYQMMVNSITQICMFEWDWGVLDEGHSIKWHRAKRTLAALRLREKCKRRLGLTGSPIANTLNDLYSQLEWLGRGWSGFATFEAFRKFYGSYISVGHGVEMLMGYKNVPLLQERLTRTSFMLKKSEALPDLPAKTYNLIDVEMTPEQQTVYDKLAEELYYEIEEDLARDSGNSITVNNVLVKLLRLSQITSGFAVMDADVDPETGELDLKNRVVDRFDPNPKLEELVEFIKQQDTESKIIVWCCYVQDVKSITARLRLEQINCTSYYGSTPQSERDAIELEWNTNPDLRVIVGNPAAGGVGLNLQGYCPLPDGRFTKADIVCFYSQDWSSVNRSQGEERPRGYVHQSKTASGVMEKWCIQCYDFCVPNTIDMQIRTRVTDKRRTALKIQDVRDILSTMLNKAPKE